MLLALLSALLLAAPTEPVAFESREDLERAVAVQVRSALEAGWALVDVSPEDDGSGIGFTLERDGVIERHVIAFDGTNEYRVRPAALPESPARPSERLLEALRGHGGISLASSCGAVYAEVYLIEGYAIGPDAGAFVAQTLAAAADLESAWSAERRAVLQIEVGGGVADLIVKLNEDGGVTEAELRRYEWRLDRVTYRRRAAMARALRGAFVSSIRVEQDGVVLRTNRGRFAIDPDNTAFRSRLLDGEYDGCGC